MKLLLVLSFLLTLGAYAKKCTYSYVKKGTKIGWKAFKTPEKKGVGAAFTDFTIATSKASSINTLLEQTAFSINTQKIDSGDKGRDIKIAKFVFSTMKGGKNIKGLVDEVKPANKNTGVAEVNLHMNGKSKDIELKYKYENSKLTLSTTIDMLDWAMSSNLAAINKACYALHKGKTWSDVDLEIVVNISEKCR